jgi:Restriction endonuclease
VKHKIKRRKKCLKQNLVFVVDKKERPLMPCTPRIARLLLKQCKARIYKHAYTGFFAIKLNYIPSKCYLQKNRIGVDTGSKYIGVSVVRIDKNQEKVSRSCTHLYEVKLRGDEITKNIEQRRMYRRNRRNRKTRYRKPRFLNRKNSRREGLKNPTMIHKFETHCKVINTLQSLLPKTKLIFEVGNFDPHLMKNERKAFNRHWGYQRGVNYGFANRKAYVLCRDNYTCQQCKKKNVALHVHHIVYRSNGGSDDESNLITLCEDCHHKLHQGKIKLKKSISQGKKKALKDATQMNYLKGLLIEHYPKARITWGYITKENRQYLKLSKEHYFDALVIASKGKKVKVETNQVTKIVKVAKGDYQLSKGSCSEKMLPKGKVNGFRRFDKVKYFGNEYFIKGRRTSGTGELMDVEGNKIDFSYMPKGFRTPSMKNMIRFSSRRSLIVQFCIQIH